MFTPGLPRTSVADGYGCSLEVIRVGVGMYRMVSPKRRCGEVLAFGAVHDVGVVNLDVAQRQDQADRPVPGT
jgi:hypothetical protein